MTQTTQRRTGWGAAVTRTGCCRHCAADLLQTQPAQSVQIITPFFSLASRLRCCTKKQLEQVNSSACLGITRTDNSSPDKSAPGSSNDSADSESSTSTTADAASFRR